MDLLVEYFNNDALFKLAKLFGRPIKMDINTSEIMRGRYARVCIEIDINQALPQYIRINGFKQVVAYEINASFCHKCGRIGHFATKCSEKKSTEDSNNMHQQQQMSEEQDWSIIERRKKKNVGRQNRSGINMDNHGVEGNQARQQGFTKSPEKL